MATRDPIAFTLSTSTEYGADAEWTEYDEYDLKEVAMRALEALVVQGYRVKFDAEYPNGITTSRIIEGAGRFIVAPTPAPAPEPSPSPGPSPSPEPPPAPEPPPSAPAPMLDFQESDNFINYITFLG